MITIVIPTFNEAAELPATLARLRGQDVRHETIVVDAESTDGTAALAREAGAQVITSPRRQRAAQMNLGTAHAGGETFLFLHADTRLAAGALRQIEHALATPQVGGGGFARRYDSSSWFLRVTCALAELRTRASGWFLGDQAIFVRRSVFEKLGGFREWDRFEDLDLARRLARTGPTVTLRPPVISAARRFAARGAVTTTGRDLGLAIRYAFSPEYRLPSAARPVCRSAFYQHAGSACPETHPIRP